MRRVARGARPLIFMPKIFPNASKNNPCIICGKGDWCSFGDRAMICRRVESNKRHIDRGGNLDGWYHFYDEKEKPAYIPPKRSAPKVETDFSGLHGLWMAATDITKIEILAEKLSVSADSLFELETCQYRYRDARQCGDFAIPMRDGDNQIIGIHLRCESGEKKAVLGSRNGLFIPQCEPQKTVYICEGASNTAALLTMGYYAIGRPSCNSGGEMLKVAIKRLSVKRIVIIADNDQVKNGRRAGQDGAKKLKRELGIPSVIYQTPSPIKDVRQLLIKVGAETAKQMIDSAVNQSVWRTT